jgi:sulfur carrier protein ThiS adenylyltransferase
MLLVRAGADVFTIVDFDTVEEPNLNRQFYFRDQVGRSKVDALRENLLRINPDISLDTRHDRITGLNIGDIIPASADIILECFDSPESKALITGWILTNMPEKTVIAVSGLAGAGILDNITVKKGPGNLIVIGDGESEALQEGTLSSRVAYAAAVQAHTAISVLMEQQ